MVMKTAPGSFEETSASTGETDVAGVNTTAATPAAVEQRQATPAPAADVGSSANVPAVAQRRDVAVAKAKDEAILQEYKNVLPPVEFGVLPRLVGAQGALLDSDKRSLGSTVDIEVVSWNDEFVVTPGVDAESAKKDVRYSADGITLSDGSGMTVADYLEILKTARGYEKASVKQYVQLVAILKKAEKATEYINNMVQISLSPQSRKGFEGFRLQETVKVRLGTPGSSRENAKFLTIKAEPKTMGSNSFTLLKLSLTPQTA